MSFQVHRESLSKRYYAPFCSTTCAYTIFYSFILIALPLIIAYNSYDFWWKIGYLLEQPEVTYTYQTTIQWYGRNIDTGTNINYFYSTNAYINQLYSSNVKFPIVRSAILDDNRDGKMERLELSVALPLTNQEQIYGFDCLIYYETKLSSRAKYIFDAVSLIGYESSTAANKISIDGDLILRQTYPFSVYGGYKNLYSNDPLYDVSQTTSARDVSIESIMRRYNSRNVTLAFHSNYQYVERRDNLNSNIPGEEERFFNASMTIRVPTQTIIYTPPISAVLKFAWVQYMSFFIVVAFLLYQLNSFLFSHKLLPAYSTADIVTDKSR
eukprot:gene191-197_t